MTLSDALCELIRSHVVTPGAPCCQVIINGDWRAVPLEWNVAKRLADIAHVQARLVDASGEVMCVHPITEEAHA